MNRLSTEKQKQIIAALIEGNSIRATCRLTDTAKGTILSVRIYRPSNRTSHLRNSNTAGSADIPPFTYGAPGDIPIVGDWNGDGIDTVGIYRPSNGKFYLRNSNTSGTADVVLDFGILNGIPVVGNW
jgi:hypothetical protein